MRGRERELSYCSFRSAELDPGCIADALEQRSIHMRQDGVIKSLPHGLEFLNAAEITAVREISRVTLRHEPDEPSVVARAKPEYLPLLRSDSDAQRRIVTLQCTAAHIGEVRRQVSAS
jgi:hypothetical protein